MKQLRKKSDTSSKARADLNQIFLLPLFCFTRIMTIVVKPIAFFFFFWPQNHRLSWPFSQTFQEVGTFNHSLSKRQIFLKDFIYLEKFSRYDHFLLFRPYRKKNSFLVHLSLLYLIYFCFCSPKVSYSCVSSHEMMIYSHEKFQHYFLEEVGEVLRIAPPRLQRNKKSPCISPISCRDVVILLLTTVIMMIASIFETER